MTSDADRTTHPARPPARRTGIPVANVPADAVKAIVNAQHGDPFAVLGPHKVASGLWEVRALRPDARGVTLLLDGGAGEALPMERRDNAGAVRPWFPRP